MGTELQHALQGEYGFGLCYLNKSLLRKSFTNRDPNET